MAHLYKSYTAGRKEDQSREEYFRKNQAIFMQIAYEDFSNDPRGKVGSILNFLGLS